ncbi:MAG: hypothetical protein RIF41_40960, partial [Polyangiaceae bacterium]
GAAPRSTSDAAGDLVTPLSWRIVLADIGTPTPTCPYCHHRFPKMPPRKRKCPECDGTFYSRKRALDGTKVLLTEPEAREDEAQRVLLGRIREKGATEVDLDSLVQSMHVQHRRFPTVHELVAAELRREAAAHASSGNWGLYRNARFNLAEACSRTGVADDALRLLLEVSLLDLNGPRNVGRNGPAFAPSLPAFDPSSAFLAPGVVKRTADAMNDLGLSLEELRLVFDEVVSAVRPTLNLQRSTDDVWKELLNALADR